MVDVAGCEDKGVGSETEEYIVDDERRAALKIDEISHCHHHDLLPVTQLRCEQRTVRDTFASNTAQVSRRGSTKTAAVT